ncbi:MAG: hypothetical protein PHN64_10085 [Desulfovibrionaceae bacterium]|nr:hypothetical protein [Desulfovibrionaceae bacterium]
MKKSLFWWAAGALALLALLPFAAEQGIAALVKHTLITSPYAGVHCSVSAVSCSLWQQKLTLEHLAFEDRRTQQRASAEMLETTIPWQTVRTLLLPSKANAEDALLASNTELSNLILRDADQALRMEHVQITDLTLDRTQNVLWQAVGWAQLYAKNMEYSQKSLPNYRLNAQGLHMLAWNGRHCSQANMMQLSLSENNTVLLAAENLQARQISLPPAAFWQGIAQQHSPEDALNALLAAPEPLVQQITLNKGRSTTFIGGAHEVESITFDWPQSHPQQLHFILQQYRFPAMDIALLAGFSLPELATICLTAQFTTTEKDLPEGISSTQTLNIFSPELARLSLSLTLLRPHSPQGTAAENLLAAMVTDLSASVHDLGFLPYLIGNCGGNATALLKSYFNTIPQDSTEQKKFYNDIKLFLEQGGTLALNLRKAQSLSHFLGIVANPAAFMQSTVSAGKKDIAQRAAQLFGSNTPR